MFRYMCHNSSACIPRCICNVGEVRPQPKFGGKCNVGKVLCQPFFLSFVAREMGANDFQRIFFFCLLTTSLTTTLLEQA